MNEGPASEATSAFVQNGFMQVHADDYARVPGMGPAMARALALEWYADRPDIAGDEGARLKGILATDQGRTLLGGSADIKIPPDMRQAALTIIRTNHTIDGGALRATDDPWANPDIVAPIARRQAQPFLARKKNPDEPEILAKTDLENTIGLAMRIPPSLPAGMSAEQAQAQVGHGEVNCFSSGKSGEIVGKVAKKIREFGDPASVTVLPITYSSKEYGPILMTLFRVRDGAGKDHFVDTEGRVYRDIDDFKKNNVLPPGYLSVPKDGKLQAGTDGGIEEEGGNTPATLDTFGKKLLHYGDKAALAVGVVAGVALIIGTDGLATPLVAAAGTAAGVWGAGRATGQLVDRAQHGQSLNPIEDEQARGLWLGLGANALGVGAFGSAARLAQLGRAGAALSPIEASVMGTVNVGANVANIAALANEGATIARHWDEMTPEQKVYAALQLGFWGVTTGVGARNAGGAGEMFNPARARESLMERYGQTGKSPVRPPEPNEPVKPAKPPEPNEPPDPAGYKAALAKGDTVTAARKLGQLGTDEQLAELADVPPDELAKLHAAAVAEYGPGSPQARMSDPVHRADLEFDPAKAGNRPTERDTAPRTEHKIGKNLKRYKPPVKPGEKAPKGDWVDDQNKVYDGCSPAHRDKFDHNMAGKKGNFRSSLQKHLDNKNVDFVVVDLTGLELRADQMAVVEKVILEIAGPDNPRIIRIP